MEALNTQKKTPEVLITDSSPFRGSKFEKLDTEPPAAKGKRPMRAKVVRTSSTLSLDEFISMQCKQSALLKDNATRRIGTPARLFVSPGKRRAVHQRKLKACLLQDRTGSKSQLEQSLATSNNQSFMSSKKDVEAIRYQLNMTSVVGQPPTKKRVRYTNCAPLKDPTLESSRVTRPKEAKTPNIFRNQDVFSENVQHDSVELHMPGDKHFQLSPANNMLRNTFFSENKHSINSDAHAL